MTDMDAFSQTKAKRFRFLHRLYESVEGRLSQVREMYQIGQEAGLTREETETVMEYLQAEGLLKHRLTGGMLGITLAGVREVEAADQNPEQPTHSPVNIISIKHMESSQLQVGTTQSTQSGTFGAGDIEIVKQLLLDAKTHLHELGLIEEDQQDLAVHVATAEAQVQSRHPSKVLLRESFRTIRNIIEGGAGSLAATALLQQLPQVIAFLLK